MIILPVVPHHHDSRSCVEDILVSTAIYYQRPFELMFALAWNFEFNPEKSNLIGQCIHEGENMSTQLLEKYHGIQVSYESIHKEDYLLDLVYHEINKKNPVIISINKFWCPWSVDYQKKHEEHPCLVIGVDKNKDRLLCIDPFNTKEIEYLSYNELHVSCKKYATFDKRSTTKIDWKKILKNEILGQLNMRSAYNKFHEMKLFATAMEALSDLKTEIIGNEILQSELLNRLKYIYRRRIQFSMTLNYLAKDMQINELMGFEEKLQATSQKWLIILNLLMKAYYTDNWRVIKGNVAEKIHAAAEDEEKIALNLQRLC